MLTMKTTSRALRLTWVRTWVRRALCLFQAGPAPTTISRFYARRAGFRAFPCNHSTHARVAWHRPRARPRAHAGRASILLKAYGLYRDSRGCYLTVRRSPTGQRRTPRPERPQTPLPWARCRRAAKASDAASTSPAPTPLHVDITACPTAYCRHHWGMTFVAPMTPSAVPQCS